MDTNDLARKFNTYIEPDQPIWYGKYVTVVPEVSKVNQGGRYGRPVTGSEVGDGLDLRLPAARPTAGA